MGASRLMVIVVTFCLAVASMPLAAGVRVVDSVGHDVPASSWTASQDANSGAWRIDLQELWNPWGNTWFAIQVDSGEVIERVRIDVDGPPAGSPVTVTIAATGPPARRIDLIEQTGTAEVILHEVNVIESLGRVEVQSINFLDVGGHVQGPIIATNAGSTSRGLRSLDVAGDLLGDVLVPEGTIRSITVLGDIGSETVPVRIEAGCGLWSLQACGDLWADIDLCPAGYAGFLHQLSADAFHGSLVMDRFDRPAGETAPSSVSLAGWMHGTWTIHGSLVGEEPVITLPAAGLRGQVIINAAADDSANWTTPVILEHGQVELVGPTYDALPASIGGGAIGLAPYRLHATACEPPSGLVVAPGNTVVDLHFFGPVTTTWGPPLSFWRRPAESMEAFEPVAASAFLVEDIPGDPRGLRVSPAGDWGGFEPGWHYRLVPASGLVCAAPVNMPVSGEVVYEITIEAAPCVADVDGSGAVDVVDMLLILALWGQSGTPAADVADLDGDGTVAIEDLLMVIGQWGECG